MAEYAEVRKQHQRMCLNFFDSECEGCPLNDDPCGSLFITYDEHMKIERKIMQWAENNPE